MLLPHMVIMPIMGRFMITSRILSNLIRTRPLIAVVVKLIKVSAPSPYIYKLNFELLAECTPRGIGVWLLLVLGADANTSM